MTWKRAQGNREAGTESRKWLRRQSHSCCQYGRGRAGAATLAAAVVSASSEAAVAATNQFARNLLFQLIPKGNPTVSEQHQGTMAVHPVCLNSTITLRSAPCLIHTCFLPEVLLEGRQLETTADP